jgi:hypothetical protein
MEQVRREWDQWQVEQPVFVLAIQCPVILILSAAGLDFMVLPYQGLGHMVQVHMVTELATLIHGFVEALVSVEASVAAGALEAAEVDLAAGNIRRN